MRRRAETINLSLRLVSEDAATVVGEDAAGSRRIFPKNRLHSCVVSRKMESVSVVIDRKLLRQLKPIKTDNLSIEADNPVVLRKRRCLQCRHEFMAHPSIFICSPCKKTSVFHSGPDYSVAR